MRDRNPLQNAIKIELMKSFENFEIENWWKTEVPFELIRVVANQVYEIAIKFLAASL